uniref:Protein HIRA-like n=1 Tax=Phallusia mammillata TaxID=59560 RepID=A0A6F9DFD6_9ASCI|nr:protein HIRA-like [Phallusia mammillata]
MNGSTSPVRKRQYKQLRKDHGKQIPPDRDSPAGQEQLTTRKETSTPTHKSVHSWRHVDPHILPLKKLTKKIHYQSSTPPLIVVTVHNELTSDDKPVPSVLHKVECTCQKIEQWTTVLSSPAVCLTVSQQIVGLACHDHSIHAISLASGRRIFPPIHFGSAVSHLSCKGHHLMAIDNACKLSVWNTKNSKSVVTNLSFSHLVDDGCHGNKDVSPLRKCLLTNRGLPVITFTNGKTFSFSLDLGAWVLIQSTSDAVDQFADDVAMETDEQVSAKSDAFFLSAKKSFNGMGAHASRSSHISPMSQRNATLAMLESKVAACVVIESVSEYRRWMLAYVRYLVQENLELRLREVCDDLIGPPAQRSWVKTRNKDGGGWKAHVLGIQKQTLLQDEVLPIIASNLAFQRLYTEYQDQLDSRTIHTLPGLN